MYFASTQEVLFLLKNASWFGTKAGEVYQVMHHRSLSSKEQANKTERLR